MEEFVPCGNCENGYLYEDTESGRVVRKCQCLVDWQKSKKQEMLFERSGLTRSDLEYSLNSYKGEDKHGNLESVRLYVDEFEDRFFDANLYFWGYDNSTQKTTVAKWILAELAMKDHRVYFTIFNDLVVLLQQYYFDQSREEEFSRIYDSECLVIDDAFDTGKSTVYKSGYQYSFIDTFLRDRLEVKRRATIFTSNIPLDGIQDSYTPSIAALVRRNVVPFEFTDIVRDGESFQRMKLSDFKLRPKKRTQP